MTYLGGDASDTRRVVTPRVRHLGAGSSATSLFHKQRYGSFVATLPANSTVEQVVTNGTYDLNGVSGVQLTGSAGGANTITSILYQMVFDGNSGRPLLNIDTSLYEYYMECSLIGVQRITGRTEDLYYRVYPVSITVNGGGTSGAALVQMRYVIGFGHIYIPQMTLTRVRKA